MLLTFLAAVLICPAAAQAPGPALAAIVVECAMNERAGPWVVPDLYRDGVVRFNYLYEPPVVNPGEYDYPDPMHRVYAAFWDPDKTKGAFLQFLWFRGELPAHLRIVNNAQIVSIKGEVALNDALWGVWTYEHLMRRLAKLRVAPLQTIPVRNIIRTSAKCDSYAAPPRQ